MSNKIRGLARNQTADVTMIDLYKEDVETFILPTNEVYSTEDGGFEVISLY